MKTRDFTTFAQFLGGATLLSFSIGCNTPQNEKETEPPVGNEQKPFNVLFIAVDDLRPELGCFGNTTIHSPNIDRLASKSIIMQRAYCNIPVSGASRACLLTGLRPTRYRFLSYYTKADFEADSVETLPEYFRKNNYYTISNSKVFHHRHDGKGSWDEEWWPRSNSSWKDYAAPENITLDTSGKKTPPYEKLPVHDTTYKDGKTAMKAIEDLTELKQKDKPFFLAVGFFKPHLPFNAPEKYWNLYDKQDIQLPQNNYKPNDAPDEAMHNFGELRNYGQIPAKGPLHDTLAHTLKHGYYACVSYTDAQIGKVLNALDSLNLAKNTIVILWGDHGWNLREHGLWCKHCNFNTSLNAPVIVHVPGIDGGKNCNRIVEYIDIYPTLCDLCNLKIPEHTEGKSFAELLKNPDKEWKNYAVCKWYDGVTYIRDNHFYTEWSDTSGNIYAQMLYNHNSDPDENINISEKQKHEALIQELSNELHSLWGKDFDKYAVATPK